MFYSMNQTEDLALGGGLSDSSESGELLLQGGKGGARIYIGVFATKTK